MEPACCIADDNVGVSRLARAYRVKDNGCGVGALFVFDDIDARAIRPYLKLIYSGGSECVGSAEDDLFALLFEHSGHFADGGSLADAVDADNKYHGRDSDHINGLAAAEHIGNDIFISSLTSFALRRFF